MTAKTLDEVLEILQSNAIEGWSYTEGVGKFEGYHFFVIRDDWNNLLEVFGLDANDVHNMIASVNAEIDGGELGIDAFFTFLADHCSVGDFD